MHEMPIIRTRELRHCAKLLLYPHTLYLKGQARPGANQTIKQPELSDMRHSDMLCVLMCDFFELLMQEQLRKANNRTLSTTAIAVPVLAMDPFNPKRTEPQTRPHYDPSMLATNVKWRCLLRMTAMALLMEAHLH
jgi:hypothetical protein